MAGILIVGAIPSGLAGTVTTVNGFYTVRFFIGILGGTFVPCQAWTTAFFDKNIVGTANAFAGSLNHFWKIFHSANIELFYRWMGKSRRRCNFRRHDFLIPIFNGSRFIFTQQLESSFCCRTSTNFTFHRRSYSYLWN